MNKILKFIVIYKSSIYYSVDDEDKFFEKTDEPNPNKGQFVAPLGKPGSGKSRLLQHLNTRISIGTEVLIIDK